MSLMFNRNDVDLLKQLVEGKNAIPGGLYLAILERYEARKINNKLAFVLPFTIVSNAEDKTDLTFQGHVVERLLFVTPQAMPITRTFIERLTLPLDGFDLAGGKLPEITCIVEVNERVDENGGGAIRNQVNRVVQVIRKGEASPEFKATTLEEL